MIKFEKNEYNFMKNGHYLVGQFSTCQTIEDRIQALLKGSGSILCISAESGYGKTHLLRYFFEECRLRSSLAAAIAECEAPQGKISTSNIQPLLPFTVLIEQLLDKKNVSPEKKLALNIGLTTLATVPFIGEVFYAVKEMSRDWKQFKKEKSNTQDVNISSGSADFFDSLCALSEKQPLILFIDDFHWADPQSVELLNYISLSIEKLRIMLVISYRKSIVETKASPFLSFIMQHQDRHQSIPFLQLEPLDTTDTYALASIFLNDYERNLKFEQWLLKQSDGVAGIISEFLGYLSTKPELLIGNRYEIALENKHLLPANITTAFAQIIENMSDDDRNTLSVCSAEGRQFSVTMVASLLNIDILTTIKKLRHVQLSSGVIKSLGLGNRYGEKTTLYEFTQTYYHTFFNNSLEFEEHEALHSRIAQLLQYKFNTAESESVRRQIAPYLAAHSAESGDSETAKSMLLFTATAAQAYGSNEAISATYKSYLMLEGRSDENASDVESSDAIKNDFGIVNEDIAINGFKEIFSNVSMVQKKHDSDDSETIQENGTIVNGNSQNDDSHKDFISMRNRLVDAYHNNEFEKVIEKTIFYINNSILNPAEKIQLYSFAIRACIEIDHLEEAAKFSLQAKEYLSSNNDPIAECLYLNVCGLLKFHENQPEQAIEVLEDAAAKAATLPPELQLLTLSNIAQVVRHVNPKEAASYYSAVRQLCSSLNFNDFAADLFNT